ncbi:beta-ketoacyl-ACP synthase II [bacterium]|nr:beta-ketoacyl-ACP synthase II [bacterium]
MPERIVVTGMGGISPVGIGTEETWNGMINGVSGARLISRFDTSNFKTRFACEVENFDPLIKLDKKTAKRMDLFCQYAVYSAFEAAEQAGLSEVSDDEGARYGVVYGSGIGGMYTYEEQIIKLHEQGPGRVSPFFIPMMIGDIASGHISIHFNFKGVNYGTQSACATSAHAIGLAAMHLRAGDADAIICGGSEAPITRSGVAGFNSMNALSTRNDDPQKASRPFDKDRDGFVIGEGAASFVLETESHAKARGAKIYAELAGYGFSADAYHLTAPVPGGAGAVRSMNAAMKSAGCNPEDIDYINAHGTSTLFNDEIETQAIKSSLGDHAYKVAVSSTKSMTGHLLGAAGAVEMLACVKAVNNGIIPPTINFETPDPQCDLYYVPNKAEERDVKTALSNTFGFGGHNATIIVRRWED